MSTSSTVLPANEGAETAGFSAWDVIVGSYRFFIGNVGSIFAVLWLPVILAAGVLFASFKIYFSMLALYLNSPDARLASLTVSATMAGLFVWLLLNVVAAARVARVIAGQRPSSSLRFKGLATEARLYAGILRYLLVLFAATIAVLWSTLSLARLLVPPTSAIAMFFGVVGALALCVVLSVRCGLLIPALAHFEQRRILRRGWELSRGHFWQLMLVWAAVSALPAALLQFLAELLMRPVLSTASGGDVATLTDAANGLATDGLALFSIIVSLTVSSTVLLVLTTIASCLAYPILGKRSK